MKWKRPPPPPNGFRWTDLAKLSQRDECDKGRDRRKGDKQVPLEDRRRPPVQQ